MRQGSYKVQHVAHHASMEQGAPCWLRGAGASAIGALAVGSVGAAGGALGPFVGVSATEGATMPLLGFAAIADD